MPWQRSTLSAWSIDAHEAITWRTWSLTDNLVTPSILTDVTRLIPSRTGGGLNRLRFMLSMKTISIHIYLQRSSRYDEFYSHVSRHYSPVRWCKCDPCICIMSCQVSLSSVVTVSLFSRSVGVCRCFRDKVGGRSRFRCLYMCTKCHCAASMTYSLEPWAYWVSEWCAWVGQL